MSIKLPPPIKKIPHLIKPGGLSGNKDNLDGQPLNKKYYALPGEKSGMETNKRVARGAELSQRYSKLRKARLDIERGPTVLRGTKKLWFNLK